MDDRNIAPPALTWRHLSETSHQFKYNTIVTTE
jgi:hypothetical protein